MTTPPEDNTRTHVVISEGTVVQHYRIVGKIGAGGMGEVYLAEDTRLNRRVALKFLPAQMADNPDLRIRFTREAQAAAKLDHPNIITIHEVGEHHGRPFFAMQYVDGKTLHEYGCEHPLPIDRALHLVAQVSDGLARAHAAGVIHRDIKSANIIVDHDARPKILDFGLATIQGGELLTRAGSTLGTVAYMSPEQAQGREVDHRSDLFSLGVVLYELIAGRTPFRRNGDAATIHAIVSESPEPLARYKADVPAEVQRVVAKALAKNPSERYQSAADFAADLRAICRPADTGEQRTTGRVAQSKPSIAVLPFANMSADPENEYFSDGLTEELLNVLAKNPDLKVTGRTSSFAFKGKQEDLRTIGQKLGVETLLEGSVRKAGTRVRITAQLVSVADGFHLWSETYDRVLDDIFAVQDDIARAVSEAMHVALVDGGERKVDPESYALTLRAHHLMLQFNKENLTVAVELFRKAIALDPTNARAWAGLSYTYGTRIAYGHSNHAEEYPLARDAGLKALELNEQLPEAHHAMALVCAALEMKIREGERHMRRAFELAPNDATIMSMMALWEMVGGKFDQAVRLAKRSVEIDPLNPFAYREYGRILLFTGHISEAREAWHRALTMSPDITTVHLGLCIADLLEGKFESAAKVIQNERADGYRYCGLAAASYAMGKQEESDQYLAKLVAVGDHWSFQIAMVHGYRGEIDQAFHWLEEAYRIHDAGIPLTGGQPLLRSLHGDPRWPVFLKKIGLAD